MREKGGLAQIWTMSWLICVVVGLCFIVFLTISCDILYILIWISATGLIVQEGG